MADVLSLSEVSKLTEQEYLRRAEKLRVMEEESESKMKMRDISVSVRKSVESEERVILGSSSVMLSLVSDYFEAMFEGDSQRGESIELSAKITADGIRAIHALALGVLSKVQVSRDNLAALIAAAQYCDVPALSQLCDEFVRRKDPTKDLSLLVQLITDLDRLGFPHLVDEWMSKVPEFRINDLFKDDYTLNMSSELFTCLVESDSLTLDESEIWLKCVKWAENQTRIHGGDVLTRLIRFKPLIRFPLMTEEFLLKKVMVIGAISRDEFVNICSVKYGLVDPSDLFCPSDARAMDSLMIWDPNVQFKDFHTLSADGTVLTHSGTDKRVNAFIFGSIRKMGITKVKFKSESGGCPIFGVIQSSERPILNQYCGFPLKGVGFASLDGKLCYPPSKHRSIGPKIKNGDSIELSVTFSDPSHATMIIRVNDKQLKGPIQLHDYIDVSDGLRFAVQTRNGSKIRICH